MFEKASRLKLRFDTAKGSLTVEDLWDLPLISNLRKVNLDEIARELHKQLRNDDNVSFVFKDRKSDATAQLKFDIVKHIIEVKLAEDEARAMARENSDKKQRILEIIAERQDEDLKGKSVEELQEMVKGLK